MRLLGLAFCLLLLPVGCVASTEDEGEQEEEFDTSQDALTASRAAAFKDANEVTMTAAQRQQALAKYAFVDHDGVRDELFERAVLFYEKNRNTIRNERWLGIIDFAKHSRERRFVVLDMEGGPARRFVVAHGSGSDRNNDGVATSFSNASGSNQSSVGFYEVAETYTGKYGLSLRLDGLSSTNSNARRRAVVIHQSTYVNDGAPKQGRSWGCPAVPVEDKPWIVANLKNGAIIYAAR